MKIKVDKNYKWTCICGKEHKLPVYVLAHWNISLEFTCSCEREYKIKHGILKLKNS